MADAPSPSQGRVRTAPVESHLNLDVPSSKYKELPGPPKTVLQQAAIEPKPLLPKFKPLRTWQATQREVIPLNSSLIGAARAGKVGELLADDGSQYTGEVLAGRPHGHGCLKVPKDAGCSELVLLYEGSWEQGRRQGRGMQHYRNGEWYEGDWAGDLRHGQGSQRFSNGDVYSGSWDMDHRTGRGTLYLASGDIFVGAFCHDKQHGMGCMYLVAAGRRMVGEWLQGRVTSSTLTAMDDVEVPVLDEAVHQEAARGHTELRLAGTVDGRAMPGLELARPHSVLAPEVLAIRQAVQQEQEAAAGASARPASLIAPKPLVLHDRTLEPTRLVALQHAYNHLAGGADAAFLPGDKVWQMAVRARLDPGVTVVQQLVSELLAKVEPHSHGPQLSRESFLATLLHFRAAEAGGQGPA